MYCCIEFLTCHTALSTPPLVRMQYKVCRTSAACMRL